MLGMSHAALPTLVGKGTNTVALVIVYERDDMHFDAPRNPIKNLGLFSCWGCLASVDGRDEDPYHKGLKAAWGARGEAPGGAWMVS